jgi:hypothetical protein
MPKTIELIIEILEVPLLRRFTMACLLPNLLVLGFKFNNLDSDRNYLWHFIVGPYWLTEKIVIGAVIFAVPAEVLWPVGLFLVEFIVKVILFLTEKFFAENFEPSLLDRQTGTATVSSPDPTPESEEEKLARKKAYEERAERKHQEMLALCKGEHELMEKERKQKEHEEWLRKNPPPVTKSEAKSRALRDITGRST